MRGHLRKRAPGSWTIVLDVGRDPATGRRRQRWIAVKGTKRDAEARMTELKHRVQTGGIVEPARLTVAEYLAGWLQDYADAQVRDSTARRYRGIATNHLIPALGGLPLSRLTAIHVQDYYARALRE